MIHLDFDEAWLRDYCKRTGTKLPEGVKCEAPEGRKQKYRNRKTETDGITFDSRHEAECWQRLKAETEAGQHIHLLRQVAFRLPGGVKYIADFVTLERDGKYQVFDAKSAATQRDKVYRLKRRQMRECLGIEIIEI